MSFKIGDGPARKFKEPCAFDGSIRNECGVDEPLVSLLATPNLRNAIPLAQESLTCL